MTQSDFLHHDLSAPLPRNLRGAVVAIGNFDGVHRGHQSVLAQARNLAEREGVACYALSFEPHPRTLFRPQSPVFRLTPEPQKAKVLQAFGMDGLLVLPFTRDLASTPADEFVSEFLVERCGAAHVVTGFNFHFGKDRRGTPDFLRRAGETSGFGVTIVEAHSDGDGEVISSSRIRRALGDANCELATQLLGYRWLVGGKVIKGAQLGRTLGYPTANLSLPESCHLAFGIYAVRLRRASGKLLDGVASYGRRPTFDNGEALLETFVFDFSGNLYDEEITVSLFSHLRGEEAFDSAEALIAQMDVDAQQARHLLASVEPASQLDETLNFADRP